MHTEYPYLKKTATVLKKQGETSKMWKGNFIHNVCVHKIIEVF
jgi:hypothetical protein